MHIYISTPKTPPTPQKTKKQKTQKIPPETSVSFEESWWHVVSSHRSFVNGSLPGAVHIGGNAGGPFGSGSCGCMDADLGRHPRGKPPKQPGSSLLENHVRRTRFRGLDLSKRITSPVPASSAFRAQTEKSNLFVQLDPEFE